MRGFIALVSVLMLSGILLLIATTADLYAYLAHEAVVDEESYRAAQQAAFSCGRLALSRLDADPLRFAGTGTTTIRLSEGSTCEIVSASVTTTNADVLVQGDDRESSVRMLMAADRATSTVPFTLRTWTEY